MVDAANMLLEAPVAPEQTHVTGGGQAAKDQDPSSSPFLAIVQDLMGSAEQTTTEPVRAGQQAPEQVQTEDGTEKPSKDAMTLANSLLGSVQIACSEVQALPTEVVTDTSAAAETPAIAVASSTALPVAPSTGQPIIAEQPGDVPADGDTAQDTQVQSPEEAQASGAVTNTELAEPLPELTTDTDVPKQDAGTVRQPVQATAEQPKQADRSDRPAQAVPVQTTERQSEVESEAAIQVDRPIGAVAARKHAERTEVPEYLRNITSQGSLRLGSKVIIAEDAQSIQSMAEVDSELAAAPVNRSAQKDSGATQTDIRQSMAWTPVDVRPAADSTVPAVTVTTQTQPVDQVERANIIHQIVRTAKVHVFDGGGEMVMRLEPAHLGSIQMSVTADQGIVTAHLKAGTESVRQALEAGLPALRQALTDAGVHVDAVSVSVGDSFSQSWNLHAGAHNGSQHAANQQHGYAGTARLFRGEDGAMAADQPASAYTGAGFNYLA